MDERDIIRSLIYVFARVGAEDLEQWEQWEQSFLLNVLHVPSLFIVSGNTGSTIPPGQARAFPGHGTGSTPRDLQDAHNPVLVTLRPIARLFPEMSEYLRD